MPQRESVWIDDWPSLSRSSGGNPHGSPREGGQHSHEWCRLLWARISSLFPPRSQELEAPSHTHLYGSTTRFKPHPTTIKTPTATALIVRVDGCQNPDIQMDDVPTATPLGEKVGEVAASPTHPPTNHPISPETLATNTSPLRSTMQEVVESTIRCLQQPQNSTPRLCSRARPQRIHISVWEENGICDPWTLRQIHGLARIPFSQQPLQRLAEKTTVWRWR
jgi:hypothetical protein